MCIYTPIYIYVHVYIYIYMYINAVMGKGHDFYDLAHGYAVFAVPFELF